MMNEKEKRDKNGLRLDVSVCAWCHVHYDRVTGETVDPPDHVAEGDRFSHGMCKPCGVKVRAEMDSEMDDKGIMRLRPRDARDHRHTERNLVKGAWAMRSMARLPCAQPGDPEYQDG